MRVMPWLKSHWMVAAIAIAVLGWTLFRWATGRQATSAAHRTPEDAIAAGWMVYQAGLTGWLEVSPDDTQRFMHDTGWTGDPFAHAG